MKIVILCIISVAFVANTLAVSANVMFCAQDNSNSMIIEVSSDTDMPCHDTQNDSIEEHCNDSCYCPVFTNNLSYIDELAHGSIDHGIAVSSLTTLLISRSQPPIYRPPIQLS